MEDFLTRISNYSPKRLALLADDLQRRLSRLEDAAHAPIAIIGMACRFPGGADTPARFWDLLVRGEDAVGEVPKERWNIDEYYDPDPDAPGKMSSRWGGFLRNVAEFDPHFFGISPREAQRMDPQHRLLLEVTWEALEHAGVNADRLAQTLTGVYVGMSSVDYLQVMRSGGLSSFDAYTASGAAHSIASGRLSYLLGTRGPSMSIDTACSSSLVAIHQAVSSLRRAESNLALAGGVNLILRPDVTVALSKSHMMAPDGRCKAFDSRADGFVRSEGCGMLVLKRLADAEAAGDPILAVIRGSASNQDGRSNGLTAPNGVAQEAVVRAALEDARVSHRDVQFVETHGTGTSLGDPIEVQALAAVFGKDRAPDDPLLIGSVKANIGHLESAAGVAAVIKAVLALKHGVVPAQLHFLEPNPFIPWHEIPVRVPRAATAWPKVSHAERLAGVSSFGFSGTNVHLLLGSAPPLEPPPATLERPRHVLVISARGDEARRSLITAYSAELTTTVESLADIAFTANAGRAALTHRSALHAASKEEAVARLAELASAAPSATAFNGVVPPRPPQIAFLFTGQGAQYAGMARSLYETQPRFREALDECAALLDGRLAQPLLSVLHPADPTRSPIHETAYTQPALFSVEYALAQLWQSWGVQPIAVLGHSVGEFVAACVAGVLTLEDALKLVVERGRLMGALPSNGAMASLVADEAQVASLIAPWQAEVAIAAVNGPQAVVISGRDSAVAAIIERAAQSGINATPLTVSHAFHSPLIEPMLAEFTRYAESITHHPAKLDVISNVTGRRMTSRGFDASYWREHARSAVQFARSMRSLAELGCDTFLEVGPHPTLIAMARQSLTDDALTWLPSLRRGADEWSQILESLAKLYVRGGAVDWAGFDAGYARRKVVLPSYPFQRQRFWVDVPVALAEAEARVETPAAPDAAIEMRHEIVWRDGPAPGAALPSPALVRAVISPRIAPIAEDNGLRAYEAFSVALDRLSTLYILNALQALGADLQPGAQFEAEALAARLGVLARHRRLFARLLQILVEDGFLSAEAGGFRVLRPLQGGDPDEEAQHLHEQHPDGAAELTITSRCARELASVLRGRTDPLPLLFPEGSLADMERLYRTSPPARTYNRLISEIISVLSRARAEAGPLRILEIGGGTGSTTAFVLPLLRDQDVEYTFTDLSPLFLNRAREKFVERSCMRFAVLDIAAELEAQGFQPASFDVIIGANVLHATPDIAHSLAQARSLVAPGGQLVLLEGTTPQRFGDLTVGLLEGWWAFTDVTRRQYALIPREAWCQALGEAGFSSSAVIVDANAGPVLTQQAIFVAQAPGSELASPVARWLIVPDSGGAAEALTEALRASGDDVLPLAAGEGALRGALADAARSGAHVSGVIHLAALDAALTDATSAAELWAGQEQLVKQALGSVHALAADRLVGAPPALWFVTRGAQSTQEGEASNPAQASLWGLSHVVALEHPGLSCRRVDLDPGLSARASLGALVKELRAPGCEDQIALRGERRLLRRLAQRAAPSATKPASIRPDCSYLITGGLRGLGLLVARWLVEQGAMSVVLMSRRAPDEGGEATLRQLRAQGARVLAITGDVSREMDVRRVLDEISRTLPPLRGIVHAAGVLDDGALAALSWPRFATVMAPKVLGTWHLHRLAGALDFFALFSSGAAIAGSAGQANHAAANAFEDALAWYRQARGLPTVSINWGPWAEVGAAADRRVNGPSFVTQIAPRDGLRAFAAALASDPTRPRLGSAQVVAIAADWSELAHAPAAWRTAPLFRELAPNARAAPPIASAQPAAPEVSLRERLRSVAANRRLAALQEQVRTLTVKVLGVQHPKNFDVHEPLRQLGLDSLMAVELRNLLAKAVGRAMPATITFDHPSVAALAEFLASDALADVMSPVSSAISAAPPLGQPEESVHDELSSAELASRLADRLDRLFSEEPK
ncbi:MAG: type I polyketide synthase [Pseudomonadota bacterium]